MCYTRTCARPPMPSPSEPPRVATLRYVVVVPDTGHVAFQGCCRRRRGGGGKARSGGCDLQAGTIVIHSVGLGIPRTEMEPVRRSIVLGLLVSVAASACSTMRVGSDYDHEAALEPVASYDWVSPSEADEETTEAVNRINPFIDRRLRRAVDSELEARGIQRVQEGPVDLLVAIDVLDVDRIGEVPRGGSNVPVYVGFGFGFNPGYLYSPWGYGGYGRYGYGYGRYGYGYGGWGGYPAVGVSVGFGRGPYFGYAAPYGAYGYQSYGGFRSRDLALPPGSFIIDILDGETAELVWRGWAEGALLYSPDAPDLPQFIASTVHRIMEEMPLEGQRPSGTP